MAQELKRLNQFGNFDKFGGFYDADEVDAVLAEKDAVIQTLKQKLMKYGDTNAFLVKENTDLKLITESKDAEIRRLKRALYKACANWARFEGTLFADEHEVEKWSKMERKCREKAEQYK